MGNSLVGIKLLRFYVYFIVIVMLLPIIMSLPIAMTAGSFITFPRSLILAFSAAMLGVLLSIPSGFSIERGQLPGRTALETMITSPRMIPQIVLVLALLIFYEKIGFAESFPGLVIAHLLITVPLAFRTLHVGISSLDVRLEWSSSILGAGKVRTFNKIVIPHLKTILIAAFTFAFIISFNNVTMALFLSAIGERTLPVEMFNRMYVGGMTPVIPAISFVLAVIGIITFVILDRTIGVLKYLSGHE